MASSSNEKQNGNSFLRSRFKNALCSSNEIFSGISSNISRLSLFSTGSSNVESSNVTNVDEDEKFEEPPLALHKLPGTPEPMKSPPSEKRSPATVTEKLKETFKFENLRPAIEDFMLSNESSEPSTLPTNTPESPKSGFRYKFSTTINQSIPRKFEDCKAFAYRTLGREGHQNGDDKSHLPSSSVENSAKRKTESQKQDHENGVQPNGSAKDLENASSSVCVSSRSFLSSHSLHGAGPDPYDKFKMKHDFTSSGSASEIGIGRSTSLDSSDSDPHKKLWIRSGSQTSLQSWASSLSYDSQSEDPNEIKEFMKAFVEDIFKQSSNITVDKKAEFGKLAQTEQGRLWFARCINAKRGCKCVNEATFFSLTQHFAVMLFECSEADDFSPAKSLMNMCFTYYHEVTSESGQKVKEFLYLFLRQHPIWRSFRFWNAAFFDALQCERFMRPVATREQFRDATGGSNNFDALQDELHYQENITFGQLGTFTCNMHSFGLSKEMVGEFLRKQVTIASLRPDQVKLLRDNVDRLYSHHQEWN
ncbi:UNVERIFIED_CONTAM: hypothetical protein RMT77_007745 [Armadillidium vulgare]